MSDAIACKHVFVSGLVQGVFFRLETQKQAQRLGITGWVRNMDDGRVEAMICGDMQQLQQMEAWLQQGPSRARVSGVDMEDAENLGFDDFLIVG